MGFKIAEVYADLTIKDSKFQASISKVQGQLTKVQGSLTSLGNSARNTFLKMGVALAAVLYPTLKEEKAILRLDAALRANGQNVDVWSKKLQAAAGKMELAVATDAEDIMDVMRLGLAMGGTADQAEDLSKQAMGLATAFDIDLNSAMKNVMLAQAGEFTMLSRYVPALRSAKTETEKWAIYQKAAAAGWEQANKQAQPFQRLMIDVVNLAKDFGRIFLEELNKVVAYIRPVIRAVGVWVNEHKKLAVALATGTLVLMGVLAAVAILAPAVGALITVIQGLATALAFLAANPITLAIAAVVALAAAIWYFRDYIVATFDSAVYYVVWFANQVGHFFGTVMPAQIQYFVDQFGNLMETLGNFFGTVFTNMWDNANNFYESLWRLISGQDANWQWTGLLEGFKSSIEEMKTMADREIGGLEQTLANRAADSWANAQGRWGGKSAAAAAQAAIDEVNAGGVNFGTPNLKADKAPAGPAGGGLNLSAGSVDQSWNKIQDILLNAAKERNQERMMQRQTKETEKQTGILKQISDNTGMQASVVMP